MNTQKNKKRHKAKKNINTVTKKTSQNRQVIKIDPDIPISELLDKYPQLSDILINEYGLHCVNCYISEFDTLREGAVIHGIEGEYFEDMIKDLESRIANFTNSQI